MRSFLILVFIGLLIHQTHAQKVGLVLSGGGAKGLAHVSVLRVLEENQIPVDYVVGTSMGSIVGGMYAAGYTPDEIEEIILSDDFQKWVMGQSNDLYNNHFFSRDPDPAFFTIGLNVEEKIYPSFNTSLAEDAVINFKLIEFMEPASRVSKGDFDSLFVPFRAIAAEIFTQEEVILRKGSLAEAVRASMAVPLFYSPVRVNNDKLLFDGGIYNNFPVDIMMEEFRPDVLIGVNVSTPLFQEYPYENDVKLLDENLFIYVLNKSDPSILSEEDVYIEPGLQGLNAADFSRVGQFLDSGLAAINKKLPEIQDKITRRQDPQELEERRSVYRKGNTLRISSVQFRGFSAEQTNYLSKIFQLSKYANPSLDQVSRGYYKLISEDFFKDVYPRLIYDPSDTSYTFEFVGKGNNTIDLDVGGYITSRNFAELYLGIGFNSFNQYLAEHAFHLYAGRFYQSLHYHTRVNIPGRKLFYIKPEITYNKWEYIDISDILTQDNSTSNFVSQNDLRIGFEAGLALGYKYKLNINGYYLNNGNQYSNTETIQSNDVLDVMRMDGMRAGTGFSSNTLNSRLYPKAGRRILVSADWFWNWERYTPGTTAVINDEINREHQWARLKLLWEGYEKLGNDIYGGLLLESVFSNLPLFSNYQGSILNAPAFYPLNDSRTRILPEFRAPHYVAGGARLIYNPFGRFDIRLEGYAFKPVMDISESTPQVPEKVSWESPMRYAGTINAVYHSPIGPVSLALNYYDSQVESWSVMGHIGYLLFNRKSWE